MKNNRPLIMCSECDTLFRPVNNTQLTCSPKCSAIRRKKWDVSRTSNEVLKVPLPFDSPKQRIKDINDLLKKLPRNAPPVYRKYLLERRAKWEQVL